MRHVCTHFSGALVVFHCVILVSANDSDVASEAVCDSKGGPCKSPDRGGYYWPMQKGDAERTGLAPWPVPSNLSAGPSWTFDDPHNDVSRATPLIDDERNVYHATSAGRVYKFNHHGSIQWKVELGGAIPVVPAIFSGSLLTITRSGTVFSLSMQTGREHWRTPPFGQAEPDCASLLVTDGLLIFATDNSENLGGNRKIIALNVRNGEWKWTFTPDRPVYNFQAATPGDGTLVFQDNMGGVYRIDAAKGIRIWRSGIVDAHMGTTAAAVSHDGIVHAASNYPKAYLTEPGGEITPVTVEAPGVVHSYNLSTGKLLWFQILPLPANQAVAVGPLGQGLDTSVVVGYGHNPGRPYGFRYLEKGYSPRMSALIHRFGLWFPKLVSQPTPAAMSAFDAATGNPQWTFWLPNFQKPSTSGDDERYIDRINDLLAQRNPHNDPLCLPDAMSQPVIAADGTSMQHWQDGRIYSIRDDNRDGFIDPNTEVSWYDFGEGAQASLGMAPGMLAVAPCGGGLYVFKS